MCKGIGSGEIPAFNKQSFKRYEHIMPFKSEKQRKYLWANEPEIARDWTDTYGSGIHKALGGRIPFQEGGFKNWLGDATGYTQHNINNQLLRNAMASNQINEEQYKRMGGYDVAQNMPNFMQNKTLPVGLASLGYQGAKTVAGWINPDDPNAQYGDVGRLGSIGLNMQGAQGLSPNDLALYHNIMTPRSAFQDDANYIPRQTMANWSELDDAEAQSLGRFTEQEEDNENNWLMRALSMVPLVGKNTRSGFLARKVFDKFMGNEGITSIYNRGYNRGQPRDPNLGRGLSGNVSWAGQQYDKQYGTGQYHIYNLKKRLDRLQKSKSTSEWNRKQQEKTQAEIRARQQATHEARQASTPGYGADPGGRQSVDTSGSRGPAGKEMM